MVDPVPNTNFVPRSIGRYTLFDEIASGGMATVHYGRLNGPAGFSRTVAIKRLHPHLARDPEFVAMFLDEAKLAANIRHPNVVQTLDVVVTEGEIFLVLEYIRGASLSHLRRAMSSHRVAIDPGIVTAVMVGVLRGLHAAHEAKSVDGGSLDIIHRDVSPQNVLVGVDGISRVLDFGVAKAAGRSQTTRNGQLKGKIAYMAPEQLRGEVATRQCDIYAAAVVAWELLTGQRPFRAETEAAVVGAVLTRHVLPPSAVAPHLPKSFDAVIMRGMQRDPRLRHATALEMALEFECCAPCAPLSAVSEWVESLAPTQLRPGAQLESVASKYVLRSLPAGEGTITLDPRAQRREPRVEVSDISHVAITSARMREQNPTRYSRLLALAGVALFAIAAAAGVRNSASPTPRGQGLVPLAPVPLPAESSSPESLESAPQSARPNEDDGAAPPESDPATALASTEPNAAAAASRPRSKPGTKVHAITSKGRPTGSACEPPYTVDGKGHKHYRAECL